MACRYWSNACLAKTIYKSYPGGIIIAYLINLHCISTYISASLTGLADFFDGGGPIGELRFLFLESILIGSVYMDLSVARVANGWTGLGVWGSVFLLCMEGGWRAAGVGMGRAAAIWIVFFLLYFCSMVGAGDIKLFCVTGMHYGAGETYEIALLTLLFALIISVGKLFYHHQYLDRILYFFQYLDKCIHYRKLFPYYDFREKIPGTWLRLSLPLCLAVIIWNHAAYRW